MNTKEIITKKKYKVYVHIVTKEISGYNHDKYYVGITCENNPAKRWENGFGYRRNKHFFNAIQKYGWTNIKHEIVAKDLSYEDACDMERLLVGLYNSRNPRYGYNKTYGGDGGNGHKMSKKEKMRRKERFIGEKNPFFNKKHTEETRKKMSLHHWDCSGVNNYNSKKVYQFDENGCFLREFPCISQAVKANGITDMCVIRAIKEKRQGDIYFWAHEEDVIHENGTVKIKEFEKYRKKKNPEKTVEQYDLDGNYITTMTNITEIAKQFNGTRQNITRAIKTNSTAYGYKWRYAEG